MEYLNTGSNLGTGYTTVLSATSTTKLLVKTAHACNAFSADTSFYLQWYDSSESSTYSLSSNVTIPTASSFQALDGTFVLDNNDYIKAKCGIVTGTSVDLTLSYMEITNSEG
jgi:hypothetical protein